jgi:hypothetical protein
MINTLKPISCRPLINAACKPVLLVFVKPRVVPPHLCFCQSSPNPPPSSVTLPKNLPSHTLNCTKYAPSPRCSLPAHPTPTNSLSTPPSHKSSSLPPPAASPYTSSQIPHPPCPSPPSPGTDSTARPPPRDAGPVLLRKPRRGGSVAYLAF